MSKVFKVNEPFYKLSIETDDGSQLTNSGLDIFCIQNHKSGSSDYLLMTEAAQSVDSVSFSKNSLGLPTFMLWMGECEKSLKSIKLGVKLEGGKKFSEFKNINVKLMDKANKILETYPLISENVIDSNAVIFATISFPQFKMLGGNKLKFETDGYALGLNAILKIHGLNIRKENKLEQRPTDIQEIELKGTPEQSIPQAEAITTVNSESISIEETIEQETFDHEPSTDLSQLLASVSKNTSSSANDVYKEQFEIKKSQLNDYSKQLLGFLDEAHKVVKDFNLLGEVAQFVVALDCSAKTKGLYESGKMDTIITMVSGLSLMFDDQLNIDCWAYAQKPTNLYSIQKSNLERYTLSNRGWHNWNCGSRYCKEFPAIEMIKKKYANNEQKPVFVIFLTCGDGAEIKKIKNSLDSASDLPIFFQFIGLPSCNDVILNEINDFAGEVNNNRGFFKLNEDGTTVAKLYTSILSKYPIWLKDARNRMIVSSKV